LDGETRDNESRGMKFAEAYSLSQEVKGKLESLFYVDRVAVVGSVRRLKAEVQDIDIIVATQQPERLRIFLSGLGEKTKIDRGNRTKIGYKGTFIDLVIIPYEEWGAALLYYTGSKRHILKLQRLAQRKGWRLNERGLWVRRDRLAGGKEAHIYEALGLEFPNPSKREGWI